MTLPPDEPELWNAVCWLLPFVGDAAPDFARLALDAETWRILTRSAPDLPEGLRRQRLEAIDGYLFRHVLNNALLHVRGALANNRFGRIPDFLDHPNLRGGYTYLMPHYLFAVLFEKVRTLRRLASGRAGRIP